MKVIGNLTKDAIIRAVASEGLSVTQVIGTPVVFETATTNNVDIAYDSNAQKVVIVYKDVGNSNAGTAIVGTVSGNAISFGSPVIFEDAEASHIRITYDANAQKVVVVYQDGNNSDYGTARVGTVSGTSISFGTVVVFRSAGTIPYDITYDSNAQKVVIAQRYNTSPYAGYGTVGTVSGTSISFGSDTQFNSGNTGRVRAVYDTNAQRVVFAYEDTGNSSHGTAVVGTVSGTSISFGSEVVFEAATSSEVGIAYDSNAQKVVIGYRDQGDSNIGKAIVGTVSGTSISFGTAAAFGAGNDEYIAVVYDADAQKIVVTYSDTTSNGKLNVGTVSGTSITFGSEVQFESGRSDYVEAVYDPIQKRVVIAYKDVGNSSYGTAVVTKTGYSAASGGTISDGAPVIVNTNGTVSTPALSARNAGEVQDSGVDGNSGLVTASLPGTNMFVGWMQADSGNSNYGTAIIGTVSGSTITYGTKAAGTSVAYPEAGDVIGLSSTTFVFIYKDSGDSNKGKARLGTVSGTGASATISFGTLHIFETGQTQPHGLKGMTRLTDTKFVIAFKDSSDAGKAKCIIGNVSGTSLSFGSATTFATPNSSDNSTIAALTSDKFVVAWSDTPSPNPEQGKVIIGTVSGNSISYGSAYVYDNSRVVRHSIAALSDSLFVIAYNDDRTGNNYGTAIAGTVSGTSITLGTPVVWRSSAEGNAYPSIDKLTSTSFVITGLNDDARGTFFEGSVSGTDITFKDGIQFINTGLNEFWSTLVNDQVIVAGCHPSSNMSAFVYTPETTTLTTENFVGIMNGATLDTASGEILSSCSVARNQTSLTPGQTYFVTGAGALSLTAGTPSVTAGTAISSTELIVKG